MTDSPRYCRHSAHNFAPVVSRMVWDQLFLTFSKFFWVCMRGEGAFSLKRNKGALGKDGAAAGGGGAPCVCVY